MSADFGADSCTLACCTSPALVETPALLESAALLESPVLVKSPASGLFKYGWMMDRKALRCISRDPSTAAREGVASDAALVMPLTSSNSEAV